MLHLHCHLGRGVPVAVAEGKGVEDHTQHAPILLLLAAADPAHQGRLQRGILTLASGRRRAVPELEEDVAAEAGGPGDAGDEAQQGQHRQYGVVVAGVYVH